VVSFPHEFLVDLFRTRGELAPVLLARCAEISFDHTRVEPGSIDLSQVVPTEYRADCVVVLHDERDAVVAAVIVEVQLRIDRDKERSWPVYVAALHAQLRCPVILLVVAPDRGVASWARGPFTGGHPRFGLEPVVIGFDDVPRITDPAEARRIPELAMLSTLANPEVDVAEAAISAIAGLPEDRNKLYWDVIMATLPPVIRSALEARMNNYVYQSEFARKYYSQGLEEGRERGIEEGRERGIEEGRERGIEEGRERGREEGLEEGREAGLRSAVLALLRARLPAVTARDEDAVAAIRDERALTELIGALGRANDAAQLRAALDAASC
jgi:flagellar biosynthesis/type III secretory pathway protein FliH